MNIIEMEVFDYSLIKNCRHYSGHTIEIANAAAQALTGNNLSSKHFALVDAASKKDQWINFWNDITTHFKSPPAELLENFNKFRDSNPDLPTLVDLIKKDRDDMEILRFETYGTPAN